MLAYLIALGPHDTAIAHERCLLPLAVVLGQPNYLPLFSGST